MNLLPRSVRARCMLAILVASGLGAGVALAEEPRTYTPKPGMPSDVDGDGVPDVEAILRKIDELATVGVKFDDEDKNGNVPMLGQDKKYHMACIDMLNVAYRAAGYDLPSSITGGKLLDSKTKPEKLGSGKFRQIVHFIEWIRRSPNFHFYVSPQINLVANKRWRPHIPFKIGDMIFAHYNDANDRHSGIVTGVDRSTGLPTHITQVSIYNENQGLHRATVDEFFALRCRMLTGYARPVSWDGDTIVDPVDLRPSAAPMVLAKLPPGAREAMHGTAPVAGSRRRIRPASRDTAASASAPSRSRSRARARREQASERSPGERTGGFNSRMGNALGAPLAGTVSPVGAASGSR